MPQDQSAALSKPKITVLELAYIAVCTALMAVCSWIAIPTAIPFTMQTFGVCLTVMLLGGRNGLFSILTFVLLGGIGVPVFAEFTGGPGILFGSTGGYIIGFVFMALIYWGITALLGEKLPVMVLALVLGMLVCYAFGTVWFMLVYSRTEDPVGLWTALGWCVFPYLIPDGIKLAIAVGLAGVLRPLLKLRKHE